MGCPAWQWRAPQGRQEPVPSVEEQVAHAIGDTGRITFLWSSRLSITFIESLDFGVLFWLSGMDEFSQAFQICQGLCRLDVDIGQGSIAIGLNRLAETGNQLFSVPYHVALADFLIQATLVGCLFAGAGAFLRLHL
jgi:hypothetical protein